MHNLDPRARAKWNLLFASDTDIEHIEKVARYPEISGRLLFIDDV